MSTFVNISPLMFASECNDIRLSANEDIEVNISIVTSDGVERHNSTCIYTPVNGEVEFGDLGKLVDKCILAMPQMRQIALGTETTPTATLTLTTSEEPAVTATATVYYCTAGNVAQPQNFCVFATQLRQRRISPDISVSPVWVPVMNTAIDYSVTLHVVYVENGVQMEGDYQLPVTAASVRYAYLNGAPNGIVKSMMGAALYGRVKVHEYKLSLWMDGVCTDSIEFTVDHRNYPEQSHWYFLNTFGLVEALTMRGHNKETHSLETTIGRAGWYEVRMDDDLQREFESHSGWIKRKEQRQYAELYRSPIVSALIAGIGEARYVIITDISVEYAYPSNEPQGFSVKWKYADSRQQWYADVVAQIKGRNIFDSTFSFVFD